jgi:CBS domain-containing protein
MTPSMPVSLLMTTPVASVTPETKLDAVHRVLAERRISSVPVLGAGGRLLGVISQTDLLRVGRLQPASLAGVHAIDLPDESAGEHMHQGVVTVAPDTAVTAAARAMVERRIHRVFVEDGGRLAGVFSTEDALVALRGLRVDTPVGEVMASPAITVRVDAEIAEATARLDRAHVSGLAVVDEQGHPVGVFTQIEALRARALRAGTPVEEVMSCAVLALHRRMPAFRAAAQAYETRARRVLVMEDRALLGVVTGLDFARLLAAAA